ncbi:NAD(P)/FAD-dependent oxidoreductase [Glaciimonas sp. Gout2]|uniref:NAD(P)/FAD-dependent oxidoreductase n=2 Tax=Glaciimonas TaxID=1229970 RepID=UPI002AB3A84A|nr:MULTISPECIES: NAD(P)/FAD-dependent oxidoreductase [unclassified Glaciimonas]MDY7546995.1 NAD(P)/FAD-dependent oxidoreductase [Glaciimonas sp. CA11.2]MEB0011158.1 NAD(P)/FAD-dependent oxidoreductase [Glaciimonas sp. Cout2]MEB0081165.1 NAD(P)/FAD-dependent oxidoreductase [Glaciimonas sp. Gout2]
MDRREILKYSVGGALWASMSSPVYANQKKLGRVVIIGAGYGGATAAKYLRMWSGGKIEVFVIEPNPHFVSCPVSNLVLGGEKTLDDITLPYDLLKHNHGIHWIQDKVVAIDPDKAEVRFTKGKLSYDKLIVATGIDFMYESMPTLNNKEAQEKIPHAWKAGPQTQNLRNQLLAMPDGGVFAITIPALPYRCPPGPYERACQVAFYLKNHKPKSKVLVLDANPAITSKRPLFERAWLDLYPGMVEYIPSSSIQDIDVATRTVKTDFDKVKSDVLNVIPPQRASVLTIDTGLANVSRRWCEVDFLTYESTVFPNIHVIGDAVDSGLPKSAHIATSQAKVCANALAFMMGNEKPDPAPVFANTCYSYADDKTAMHVTTVYRYDAAEKLMKSSPGGGISAHASSQEFADAQYWALNIWADVLT